MQHVYLSVAERRATTEALKIARSVDGSRPILRTVMVRDGHAYVTDSYRLVNLPWLAELPEGNYDADDLHAALKGAGQERARIVVDAETVTVERFEAHRGLVDPDDLPAELGPWLRGVFPVRTVEGSAPNPSIFLEAFEQVTADDYVPEGVPAFNGDFLASLVRCHPEAFDKRNVPVAIRPRGDLRPAVMVNGRPFAIIMPMRVS